MSKLVWSLIMVMLLHSFFTCAVAAGHVEDSEHSFDYAYEGHSYSEHNENTSDSEPNHEQQFHAHVSCITGYAPLCSEKVSPALAIAHKLLPFDSKDNQPPVPPPNV